jgi:hypothetical protein
MRTTISIACLVFLISFQAKCQTPSNSKKVAPVTSLPPLVHPHTCDGMLAADTTTYIRLAPQPPDTNLAGMAYVRRVLPFNTTYSQTYSKVEAQWNFPFIFH